MSDRDYSTCDALSGCHDGIRPIDPDFIFDTTAVDQAAEMKREMAAKALFPCPIHDPERFLLWRAGEWPHRTTVGRLAETLSGEVTINVAAVLAATKPAQAALDLGVEP